MQAPTPPTRHKKRKRESDASAQRIMARKLHQCADVRDSFSSLERSLQLQWKRYKSQQSKADELSRIHVAVAQMTHFQTLFGAEMDGENVEKPKITNLGKRTDKLLIQITSRKNTMAQRTQKMVKRLPHLLKRATSIVAERRRLLKEHQELPGRHQWVPMILWRLYDAAADGKEETKPLKRAMHSVMKTLKETNPFFYLQVLYQPPPSHLNEQWTVTASEKLTAITASMTPHFRALNKRSAALRNKRDAFVRTRYGWNQLRVTLSFARRAARHFHLLILHIYSVAMQCDASNVNAAIISEQATSGILRDDVELRAQLKLKRDSVTSEDHLLKESYEWTPELLVYLDKWRESGRVLLGFERRERLRVASVWTRHFGFKSMRIEDIGALERRIKGSLGAVVDLVYKMTLARWMDRRKRPTEWWTSLELCEDKRRDLESEMPDESLEDYAEGSRDDVADVTALEQSEDVTDVESVELKEIRRARAALPPSQGFRRPTTGTLRGVVTQEKVADTEEQSGDVSKQSETERIAEIHAAMVGQCGRLRLSKSLASETNSECMYDDWRVTCIASNLCRLTDQAVRLADEAEVATSKKVQLSEEHSTSVQEERAPTIKELHKSLASANDNVAQVLALYDGQHSTEWCDTILSTGLATVELLRKIAQDEVASHGL
ncbi:hypothetical protein PInf_010255 [Phytophthora infestans]|nr:hypothetical protein PInf_010255 [Phytophthora infestans]